MEPLDTPDCSPPRYNVKVKHKTKGANTIYKCSSKSDWIDRLHIAAAILFGGLAMLQIQWLLINLHLISPF